MDVEWAIEVLEWWVEHAQKARATIYSAASSRNELQGYGSNLGEKADALHAREDQTRRVIARVLNQSTLPDILHTFDSGRLVSLSEGIEVAKYALGRLRTDAETREKLGSAAPTMAADALHPNIWTAASARWDSGHYSDAVQRAATFLNAEVQDRTGRRDNSDAALMKEVFSMDAPTAERPRLRWPGADDDQTVRAMRIGILNYAQGVFSAIRNPATHSTDNLERQVALEQLAALSVLARWIDECELQIAD